MSEKLDPYRDIRPYNDDEVSAVLKRLVRDAEFKAMIARVALPGAPGWATGLLRPLVGLMLRWQLRRVRDVHGLQLVIKRYLDAMIESHVSCLTISGLEALDPDKPWLFLSNHRDIVLDPAFVNYALYHNGHSTVRIAIGDNLLSKPFVSDLMRVNKSFIVPRSSRGPRQMLAAYRHLSAYIHHSIHADREPLWIAHREGRAKDGRDVTEPAIIKMLGMSRDKGSETLAEHLNGLNIVPVSISYEWDPCDVLKAKELVARDAGHYQKALHEDLNSIAVGVQGEKGHVHVAFGEPLTVDTDDPRKIAASVDRAIVMNYVLQPSNILAWRRLEGPDADLPDFITVGWPAEPWSSARSQQAAFDARIRSLPTQMRGRVLAMYANPVYARLARGS